MFDSLHNFLYSNNTWIIPLALIVAGYFSYRIWVILRAQQPEPAAVGARPPGRRTPRPQPADAAPAKPIQQQFLADKPVPPASVTAGEESHKHKAQAATIRIRSDDQRHSTIGGSTTEMIPADKEAASGDEVGKLFAGLDDTLQPSAPFSTATPAPAAPKSSDSQRRASRLEVLGFHHSIETDKVPPSVIPPAPPASPAPGAAPALDDILARLDRVLADDLPAKPTPPAIPETPPAPAIAAKPPAAKAPVWARADAQDEDLAPKPPEPGEQLGLFDEDKKA